MSLKESESIDVLLTVVQFFFSDVNVRFTDCQPDLTSETLFFDAPPLYYPEFAAT